MTISIMTLDITTFITMTLNRLTISITIKLLSMKTFSTEIKARQ
jgi:hypothetical protein